jgi:cytochrome P450
MSLEATTAAREALDAVETPEGWEDPYPHYAVLREAARVFQGWRNTYLVSRYEDCLAVAKSADYRNRDDHWYDEHRPGWRANLAMECLFRSLLYANPPAHTRLRRLVGAAFSAQRVERLRQAVEGMCAERLDALAEAGAGGAETDFQRLVASPLPFNVISQLVGVPRPDWPALAPSVSDYGLLIEPKLTPAEHARANDAARVLRAYFTDLIGERRRRPADDLVSALIAHGQADGEPLSDDEMLDTFTMLFSAGSDTSTSTLGNGCVALVDHPDQMERLRRDPSLGTSAAEEIIRFDPPIHFSSRYAVREVELGGVTIPENGTVLLMLGGANRDPGWFPDPDRFDIGRTGTHVISFGSGIHYCLGAPLARLEASVLFPELVRRFPRLRLAGRPVRRRGPNMRGFSAIPVAVS